MVARLSEDKLLAPALQQSPNANENIKKNDIKAQVQTEMKHEQRHEFDLRLLEPAKTVLYDCGYQLPAVTFRSVDWKLYLRKEVI